MVIPSLLPPLIIAIFDLVLDFKESSISYKFVIAKETIWFIMDFISFVVIYIKKQ